MSGRWDMKHVTAVDFGSIFTKISAADLTAREPMLSDKVPSTVGTDASMSQLRNRVTQ